MKSKKKVRYVEEIEEDVSAIQFSQREVDIDTLKKSTQKVISERKDGKAISHRIFKEIHPDVLK